MHRSEECGRRNAGVISNSSGTSKRADSGHGDSHIGLSGDLDVKPPPATAYSSLQMAFPMKLSSHLTEALS